MKACQCIYEWQEKPGFSQSSLREPQDETKATLVRSEERRLRGSQRILCYPFRFQFKYIKYTGSRYTREYIEIFFQLAWIRGIGATETTPHCHALEKPVTHAGRPCWDAMPSHKVSGRLFAVRSKIQKRPRTPCLFEGLGGEANMFHGNCHSFRRPWEATKFVKSLTFFRRGNLFYR